MVLAPSRGILGPSWGAYGYDLGTIWGHPGASRGDLGASGSNLGHLGVSRGQLGASWGILKHLGAT